MMIETSRLILREMNMDDYDALYEVLADSDIMQHYPYPFDEKRVLSGFWCCYKAGVNNSATMHHKACFI